MNKIKAFAFFGMAALGMSGTARIQADDANLASPTFYKDILPVLQAQCIDCHRQSGLNLGGMIAPMALTSYDEVRPWTKSIIASLKDGSMPPWDASDEFHGVFRNERKVTDAQIEMISRWAASGAPAGDPKEAPAPKEYPQGEWALGTPDMVLTFNKPYMVKDEIEDLNTNIMVTIPEDMLPEDRYVTSLEFKPGSNMVHHILGFVRPPKEHMSEGLQMIGGIAPGSQPTEYTDGYGLLLRKGSTFIFQMHYHKEPGPGTGKEDVSSVAFKFAEKPSHRIYVEAIGDPMRLAIPANAERAEIMSRRKWDKDFIVMGYLPHMHLRGTYALYEAILPDGTRERLLETPNWDFNWQIGYEYPEPRKFPAGTIIEATMAYNNSTSNPANPDPNKALRFGSATTDEMNLAWLTWGYAQPAEGDKAPRAIGGGNDDLPALPGAMPRERKQLGQKLDDLHTEDTF